MLQILFWFKIRLAELSISWPQHFSGQVSSRDDPLPGSVIETLRSGTWDISPGNSHFATQKEPTVVVFLWDSLAFHIQGTLLQTTMPPLKTLWSFTIFIDIFSASPPQVWMNTYSVISLGWLQCVDALFHQLKTLASPQAHIDQPLILASSFTSRRNNSTKYSFSTPNHTCQQIPQQTCRRAPIKSLNGPQEPSPSLCIFCRPGALWQRRATD